MDRVGRVWEYEVSFTLGASPLVHVIFFNSDSRSLTGRPAGKYCFVRLVQMPQESLTNPASATLPVPQTIYSLHLHTAPISSVRARPLPGAANHDLTSGPHAPPHLLTAGWDGLVGVWDLTPGVNEGDVVDELAGERKKKRRKQATGSVISKVSQQDCAVAQESPGIGCL